MPAEQAIEEDQNAVFERSLMHLAFVTRYVPDNNGFLPHHHYVDLCLALRDVAKAALPMGHYDVATNFMSHGASLFGKFGGKFEREVSRETLLKAAEECAGTVLEIAQTLDKEGWTRHRRHLILYAAGDLGKFDITNGDMANALASIWTSCATELITGKGEGPSRVEGLSEVITTVKVALHPEANPPLRQAADAILKSFKPDDIKEAERLFEARSNAALDAG